MSLAPPAAKKELDKGDYWTVGLARLHGVTVLRSDARSARWPLEVENRSGRTIWFLPSRPSQGQRFLIYTRLPDNVNPDYFYRLDAGTSVGMSW